MRIVIQGIFVAVLVVARPRHRDLLRPRHRDLLRPRRVVLVILTVVTVIVTVAFMFVTHQDVEVHAWRMEAIP